VIDAFVDELDLGGLGFAVTPATTGRPAYHPATLLKLYVYGYLNRVPPSCRLEREAGRNVELMWLTGKLAPDHKTIANFRKDHGPAIQAACAHFVVLCRQIGLSTQTLAAVDGSKFKAESRTWSYSREQTFRGPRRLGATRTAIGGGPPRPAPGPSLGRRIGHPRPSSTPNMT
jgi:transposase